MLALLAEHRGMLKEPHSGADPAMSGSGGGKPLAALTSSAAYEWVLHRGVTGWYLFLCCSLLFNTVTRLIHLDLSTITPVMVADFLSRISMLFFFLMAGWLTLVRQAPVAKARGATPRLAALAAVMLLFAVAYLPRLEPMPDWVLYLSAALTLCGDILSVAVLCRLGRSFSVMAEARRPVTDGPYRIIRHPLYFVEAIAMTGVFLPYASARAALLFCTILGLQLMRMGYEEQVLRETFPEYRAYAARTHRLIPGVW
jgi:protein-S-isoprenylcysteine O-methyltransferase Ste14